MESPAHLALKHAALRELARRGCTWSGVEVPGPMGRFRVDAAGLLPETAAPPARGSGWLFADLFAATMLVECKASRADFLRCTQRAGSLRRRRERLRARAAEQAAEFAGAECVLAPGGLLALPARPARAVAKVERALERLEGGLYAAAKFDLFTRYRLADRLLLLTAPGVMRARECPPGWGWAESDGAGFTLRVEPPVIESAPRWRAAVHRAARRGLAGGVARG